MKDGLVAILDAGAQYGKVIDRRVRALNVESHLLPMNTSAGELAKYSALIISGGPESVYAPDAPKYDPQIFALKMPILGICYGMQLLAYEAGAKVAKGGRREDGPCSIVIKNDSLLFQKLSSKQNVLMSHGDSVTEVPKGWRKIGQSNKIIAAMENPAQRRYGVQFHPEVDLTEHGKDILRNFLYDIAKLSGSYTMEDRTARAIAHIKEKVGVRSVLILISGGVDSAVCAALLNKALGSKKVVAVHIDTGFMRTNESAQVKAALEKLGLKITVVDAAQDFYKRLEGVTDPEIKRQRIGDMFIKVAERTKRQLGLDHENIMLAQGTLRPDLIESASHLVSGTAQTIKTHHNDSPAARNMRESGLVVEPLTDYHKDEVRELGIELGLPEEIVWRQPFPGPGLAIRLLCAKNTSLPNDFKKIQQSLRQFKFNDVTATLLRVRTVGVQGDGRTYSYVVGLSGKRKWPSLMKLAREIPKTIHQVNRVVYVFGDPIIKPATTITPTFLTEDALNQLRQADSIVNEILRKYGLIRRLSQVPVISFPVNFGIKGKRSIAIRTFITNDFMTGVPAVPKKDMPEKALDEMVNRILHDVKDISRVVYDLTSKPPGTTEWE